MARDGVEIPHTIRDTFVETVRGGGRVVALTGAGVSAESGIPTFRGEEGYWTVGSRNYHPMELATRASFGRLPWDVWRWYLYRRTVCHAAEPNPGHLALVQLERVMGDRLRLVTQNVDGLHLRAGHDAARLYQIHGNIDFMRCSDDCHPDVYPLPDVIGSFDRERPLEDPQREALVCPACGGRSRPHVLWFDEYYDEEHFFFESSLRAAAEADVLLVIGTSGATNLPLHMARTALRRQIPLIDVNMADNVFAEAADETPGGGSVRGSAATVLPALLRSL